jgi:hypothetical protein
MPESFSVTVKPLGGSRRRITFEPAAHVTDRVEHSWWQIEEVYETDGHGMWREVGREAVSKPQLDIDVDGGEMEVPE